MNKFIQPSITNYPVFHNRLLGDKIVLNDIESILTPLENPTTDELRLRVRVCNAMVQAVRFMLGDCIKEANITPFVEKLFEIICFQDGDDGKVKTTYCLDVFAMLGTDIKGDENGLAFIKNLDPEHVDALIAILPMLKDAYMKNLLKLLGNSFKKAGIADIYNGFESAKSK